MRTTLAVTDDLQSNGSYKQQQQQIRNSNSSKQQDGSNIERMAAEKDESNSTG